MKLKLLILVLAHLILLKETPCSAQEPIQFSSNDNFDLNGFLYKQPAQAHAILLLHQCDLDQSMYNSLASGLFKNGFHVMTFDYRGIGLSASSDYDLSKESRNNTWKKIEEKSDTDMNAAFNFFKTSADIKSISIFAASCGGNKAINLALQNKNDVKALGFFSSRLSSASILSLNQLSSIPMIFIVSEDDKSAYEASVRGIEINKSNNTTSYFYPGREHGFPLFKKDARLEEKIIKWFNKIMQE